MAGCVQVGSIIGNGIKRILFLERRWNFFGGKYDYFYVLHNGAERKEAKA